MFAPPVALAPDLLLLVSLYVLEASAWLVGVASGETAVRSLLGFPLCPAGVVLLVACLMVLAAAAVVVQRYRTGPPRRLGFTVALNLAPVLLLLAAGELAVRLTAHAPGARVREHRLAAS